MNADSLVKLVSLLLIINAVVHVAVAALGAPLDLKLPLIAFGLVYGALGMWLRTGGGRTAMLVALVVTVLGLAAGGSRFLAGGAPIALLPMFAIDAAVLVMGAMWLMKSKAAAP